MIGFGYDQVLFKTHFTALASENILSYEGGVKMCLIFFNIDLILFILCIDN
jgi:hypothetical protein